MHEQILQNEFITWYMLDIYAATWELPQPYLPILVTTFHINSRFYLLIIPLTGLRQWHYSKKPSAPDTH